MLACRTCLWVVGRNIWWTLLVYLKVHAHHGLILLGCFLSASLFVTALRGCWLCSTSLPGGHQVDGLPPAPSNERGEKVGNAGMQTIYMTRRA